MKTTLFILALFLFALSSIELSAQTSDDVVIIRIQELTKGGDLDSKMVVIKPDNSIEDVPLGSTGIRTDPAGTNGLKIKEEISKWRKLGYKNINISSGGDFNTSRTIIVLTKD